MIDLREPKDSFLAYPRLRISKHLNLRKFLLLFSFGVEEGLLGPEEAVSEAWGEEEQTREAC